MAKKSLKGIRKRPQIVGPRNAQEKLFCERWLIHFDKDRAWREAGYAAHSNTGTVALNKLQKFAEYLRPIREAKAKIMAERIAVDAEKIIQGMSRRVFFDPTTFYERSSTPLTERVMVNKKEVERVKVWDGKPVYGERLRPYSDLTAEQQAVVEITSDAGGRIHYRLPSIREQHTYFTSLGKQLGMFAEKLILERHNHQHTHHSLTFEGIPTPKLLALQRQLLPLVGLEFAQTLGYTAEDIADASTQEGVLMPEKTSA